MTTADDLRAWTRANLRARRAYRAMPTACADWCPKCAWPVEKRCCQHCKAVMRMRDINARRREEGKQ